LPRTSESEVKILRYFTISVYYGIAILELIMRQAANKPTVVELITFQDEHGDDFWVYLEIPVVNYLEYRVASESDTPLVLRKYGEPVACGPGLEPPTEVVKRMELDYGLSTRFQEQIKTIMENGR